MQSLGTFDAVVEAARLTQQKLSEELKQDVTPHKKKIKQLVIETLQATEKEPEEQQPDLMPQQQQATEPEVDRQSASDEGERQHGGIERVHTMKPPASFGSTSTRARLPESKAALKVSPPQPGTCQNRQRTRSFS